MNQSSDLRSRIEELPDEPIPHWKPLPGTVLVGTVVSIELRSTRYDDAVPVVVVRDEDTDLLLNVWCLHTVLRGELQRARPRIGERIAIRRLEDSTEGYKRYRVLVDREQPAGFDWGRISTDAGDVAPEHRERLLRSQAGDPQPRHPPARPRPTPEPSERDGLEYGDDELPF